MNVRTLVTSVCCAGIVAGFVYAWWYDTHPRTRHTMSMGSGSAGSGSGAAAMGSAAGSTAQGSTAQGSTAPGSAAPGPGSAGPGSPTARSSAMRARVVEASTWIDITVMGAAAPEVCAKLVANLLARHVPAVTPKLLRGCEPTALPALVHPTGVELLLPDRLDDVDLLLLGVHDVRGTTATLDRLAVFETVARCEAARDEIAKRTAKSNDDAGAAIAASMSREVAQAKQEVDRVCTRPTAPGCPEAAQNYEVVKTVAARQGGPPPAPALVATCRPPH